MASWYSRSADPANLVFHRRARIGTPNAGGAIVWNQSFRLSPDTPVVIGQDPGINPFYMGRYDQIAGANNGFSLTWSDNRDPYQGHSFQPDVRFARVASAPAPTDLHVSMTASQTTVALGGKITIDVEVAATGAAASDVYVALSPGRLVFESATVSSGSCDLIGGIVACSLSTVPSGSANARTIEIRAGVYYETGDFTLSAIGTTSSRDTTPASNIATLPITIVNGAAVSHNFSTGDVSIPIPDGSAAPLTIPLRVSFSGKVVRIVPQVRIGHTVDDDLDISLVSPDGAVFDLSSDNGDNGDDYGSGALGCAGVKTSFYDLAETPIVASSPPFAGTFHPEQSLAGLLGTQSRGTWQLVIDDDVNTAVAPGTLYCARLLITRRP